MGASPTSLSLFESPAMSCGIPNCNEGITSSSWWVNSILGKDCKLSPDASLHVDSERGTKGGNRLPVVCCMKARDMRSSCLPWAKEQCSVENGHSPCFHCLHNAVFHRSGMSRNSAALWAKLQFVPLLQALFKKKRHTTVFLNWSWKTCCLPTPASCSALAGVIASVPLCTLNRAGTMLPKVGNPLGCRTA